MCVTQRLNWRIGLLITRIIENEQSIEVFEKDEGVISNVIWEALQPHIPSLTEYVKKSIDKETGSDALACREDRYSLAYYCRFQTNSTSQMSKIGLLSWIGSSSGNTALRRSATRKSSCYFVYLFSLLVSFTYRVMMTKIVAARG